MKIVVCLFIELVLMFQQCNNNTVTTKKEETALERENRLIDDYHKQVVISKGKEALFIPKNEVGWYFNNQNFVSIDDADIDDNICFFDTLGNIQYQALVASKINSSIKIKCQNLKSAEYYITDLNIDSIKDLDKGYPYLIKAYKRK